MIKVFFCMKFSILKISCKWKLKNIRENNKNFGLIKSKHIFSCILSCCLLIVINVSLFKLRRTTTYCYVYVDFLSQYFRQKDSLHWFFLKIQHIKNWRLLMTQRKHLKVYLDSNYIDRSRSYFSFTNHYLFFKFLGV